MDDLLELRALPPQGLGSLRLTPYLRILELTGHLRQALALAVVVKDTPSGPGNAL
jgi:hypothetical protein